jgi:1-phosphatidylinositol-3-phosphate 5-kinase
MVRVCNLCLEKLAKVEEDDDDDRRSIISSVTSFPAHQLGLDSFITHPQSPFAASQLFGPTDEPFNLYSIAETKRPHFGSVDDTPPETPYFTDKTNGVWGNPAPFRRPLPDEEKDQGDVSSFNIDIPLNSKGRVEFPTTKPITIDTSTSSIQFPIGSPERSGSPRTLSRSRPNTYGEYEVATPFIRSRVQSRLDTSFDTEPNWRIRRESTA